MNDFTADKSTILIVGAISVALSKELTWAWDIKNKNKNNTIFNKIILHNSPALQTDTSAHLKFVCSTNTTHYFTMQAHYLAKA